jgi:lipoprotein-releasing system ATP-binding protein
MESNETIIAATDLIREFRTTEGVLQVLKGISLEVHRGQMVAVTGASGVGKSTLLHVLGGLDRPTAGSVTFSGTPFGGLSEAELARFRNRKVGFVFQFHYLLDDFSALENVMIPMILGGRSHSEAATRGEQLLEQVGLKDRMTHRPKEMSGGEQQRVAVARALANEPDVVLADEPSGNLDTVTGRKLHELMFQLNEANATTFLVATHNRELADRCDLEFQLVEGRLAQTVNR